MNTRKRITIVGVLLILFIVIIASCQMTGPASAATPKPIHKIMSTLDCRPDVQYVDAYSAACTAKDNKLVAIAVDTFEKRSDQRAMIDGLQENAQWGMPGFWMVQCNRYNIYMFKAVVNWKNQMSKTDVWSHNYVSNHHNCTALQIARSIA